MVSASALINIMLTQMQEYIKEGALKDVQLVMYMNLADYSFLRNENQTAVSENSDRMHELIRLWQQDLLLRGLTTATIRQYSHELKQLIIYVGLSPLEMQEYHVKNYLAFGKVVRKWKDKTYNSKIRSLKSFFTWAHENKEMRDNPLKNIKTTKEEYRMQPILTAEQREIMRCVCRTERELAVLDLLYSSGGRVSEIVQLNIEDMDFVNRRARIYGKGRKEREIYFSPQASLHIRDYLNERKDSNPALLVGVKAPYERLSIAGIQYILKDIQSRDERLHGLKISPHTFRRTCGTDMINRGGAGRDGQGKAGSCQGRHDPAMLRENQHRSGQRCRKALRGCIGGWRNERQRYGQDTVPVLSIQKNEKIKAVDHDYM